MSHRKKHHADAAGVVPAVNESSFSHALNAFWVFLSRHWAWPVIIMLWWFFRMHRNLSDAGFAAFFVLTGIVVTLGWKQLTTSSTYWRGYFTILLVFAGVLVFIGAFPVLFILFLIALVALGIDLFFVAPHRGL